MELDFTKLNRLATAEKEGPLGKKLPQKGTLETQTETGEYTFSNGEENAPETEILASEGIALLQRKADLNRAEKEQALAVYRDYQENIKRSGELQREIQDGLYLGTDIYSLFLKAVEAISLMTSDKLFYSQTERNLKAVYGVGLRERVPLELELKETESRLAKLREARERRTEPADSLQRIDRAIKAHEKRARQLRDLI